jgi:hypothetical protein
MGALSDGRCAGMSPALENWPLADQGMTRKPDQQRRPRTWDELRRRVLEQDHLEVSELEYSWDDLIREKSEQNQV